MEKETAQIKAIPKLQLLNMKLLDPKHISPGIKPRLAPMIRAHMTHRIRVRLVLVHSSTISLNREIHISSRERSVT